jgi:hypothetical protein
MVGGAGGVGAAGQFGDDLDRTVQREDAVKAAVADVQRVLDDARLLVRR